MENKLPEAVQPSEETRNRWTVYPIKYPKLYDLYRLHKSTLWHAEDIDYGADRRDIEALEKDPNRFHYLCMVLAFFAASDGIVNENLAVRFYNDIQIPEARMFYTLQMFMETEHAETYSLLIDMFVRDPELKARLFDAINNYACVKKKADWALKWIDSQESLAKRLFAFAVVEGIFFSGSFCAIYWFKDQKLLKNSLAKANDYIMRDETLHWKFAAAVFHQMNLKLSQAEMEEILRDAVNIECEFVSDALPVTMIGMNADLMQQYIRHVADLVIGEFGYSKVYGDSNPFEFMKKMGLDGQKNFFEERSNEYVKALDTNKELTFDDDF